jgi:PAS domain S-box-containing protein
VSTHSGIVLLGRVSGPRFLGAGATILAALALITLGLPWVTVAVAVAALLLMVRTLWTHHRSGSPGVSEVVVHEQQARKQADSIFRSLVEAAPDAMIVVDQTGTILLVNERTETLFDYPRGELIGQAVETLIPERFRGPHAGHRTGYAVDPHARPMGTGLELSGRRRDGTEFPVEVSLSPMETEAGTLVTAAVRDVTERRRLEEDRHRAETLLVRTAEDANRLKSEFLANMSHELRTPLNAIIGFAELLHDGKTGPVTGRQKEFLKDILQSGEHLLQLINDVLDLSKIEAGRIELRPVPVRPTKLIGEVTDVLRTLAARKQIRIETEVDPSLGTLVTDPARLKQVLYNYLSNALKFTPPDGRVVVRVRPEGREAFQLEVEDTGIGIRPEDMDRLFVEFQQLHDAEKGQAGTGLGLALTKRLVEAQGGRVGARSALGHGSAFFAVLPLVRPEAERLPRPVRAPGVVGGLRILVIEDEPDDRRRISHILTAAGHAVEAVGTGAEGLACCTERSYEAIILDLMLPDMHGRDLLRVLHEEGLNRHTPVIVATVVTDRAVLAGFRVDDVLCKPVVGVELLTALRRATVPPGEHRPVLVVDDDPEALKITAAALLELGYRPTCVSTPGDALRRAQHDPPAAVLVDPLMTELHGFEFLSQFRRSAIGRRTPIIVCTLKQLPTRELRRRLGAIRSGTWTGEGEEGLIEVLAEAGGASGRELRDGR